MKLENLVSIVSLSVFLGALASETVHSAFSSGVYDISAVGLYLAFGVAAVVFGCAFGVALGALRPGRVKAVVVAPKCPLCGELERVEAQLVPVEKTPPPKTCRSTPNLDMEYKESRRKLTIV